MTASHSKQPCPAASSAARPHIAHAKSTGSWGLPCALPRSSASTRRCPSHLAHGSQKQSSTLLLPSQPPSTATCASHPSSPPAAGRAPQRRAPAPPSTCGAAAASALPVPVGSAFRRGRRRSSPPPALTFPRSGQAPAGSRLCRALASRRREACSRQSQPGCTIPACIQTRHNSNTFSLSSPASTAPFKKYYYYYYYLIPSLLPCPQHVGLGLSGFGLLGISFASRSNPETLAGAAPYPS